MPYPQINEEVVVVVEALMGEGGKSGSVLR